MKAKTRDLIVLVVGIILIFVGIVWMLALPAEAHRTWQEVRRAVVSGLRIPETDYLSIAHDESVERYRAAVRQAHRRWDRLVERRAELVAETSQLSGSPAPNYAHSATNSTAPGCDSACIQCESGWNPNAYNPAGPYWGLYQFDYGTWIAHGGTPEGWMTAPAPVQHDVASRITYDAWPNC